MGTISSNFSSMGGGVLMCMIAFSIVFLVCGGLMFLMYALKHLVAMLEKKDAKPEEPKITPSPTPLSNMSGVRSSPGDDEQIVAVIAAAITAASGTDVNIVSVRPSGQAAACQPTQSLWRLSGRLRNYEGL
jgi:Na+-transporting methylmalonyl-CoA/oxaloacetate decarboxylase gamma subunit